MPAAYSNSARAKISSIWQMLQEDQLSMPEHCCMMPLCPMPPSKQCHGHLVVDIINQLAALLGAMWALHGWLQVLLHLDPVPHCKHAQGTSEVKGTFSGRTAAGVSRVQKPRQPRSPFQLDCGRGAGENTNCPFAPALIELSALPIVQAPADCGFPH